LEAAMRAYAARVLAAFLIAPLPACAAFAMGKQDPRWFVAAVPFAYAFSLTGLPVFFLFRRLGWLHLWQVVLASATLGSIVAFVGGFNQSLDNVLHFVGYSALTGLAFWLIACSRDFSREPS